MVITTDHSVYDYRWIVFEILLTEDSFEMLEELEFYSWIASRPIVAAGGETSSGRKGTSFRGDRNKPALAIGCECEARPDVLTLEVGKIAEDFIV